MRAILRACAFGFVCLAAPLSFAGVALAGVSSSEANDADWVSTEQTIASALSTGKYEIRASYRASFKDSPITVYVLQNPADRTDVLECYSNDAYQTPVKCVKPKAVR
jgi:hypothetical protein